MKSHKQELFENVLTMYTQSRLLTTMKKKAFKNIVGKGKNAGK